MTVPTKPIFVATHPRACSTAFERVFMARRDILQCVHEPFGDAFYYGPERLSERFEQDEEARRKSGFEKTTFADVLQHVKDAGDEGKRVFIKDIAYYLLAPDGKPTKVAASFNVDEEPENPTTIPLEELQKFQFTFLIRHPRRSIPSYYRCTLPPLVEMTGFDEFMPNEAGYAELRRLFDYLIKSGVVPKDRIVVLDADDMLDQPEKVIREYCARTDINFTPNMLEWTEEDDKRAKEAFEKWKGFHEDALASSSLRPRKHPQTPVSREEDDASWRVKFGETGQKVIRQCVDDNEEHYNYLKQFAMKF
ncbi:Branched-chain-amino-acid aminotransferase-like protein 2 [Ceratocystis lukuohia]|uniref:Branched-chain-amino-acid aminotransferase-like protein 2 n=3 Tax=Ceratocystis TaxID=5157 RepID=A0A0F8B5R1_CERFI|nr:Branched-chain-amino-acid aminotransferase-like protein 2 [Ceratocystis platani]PHH55398.1 hypothetical protein CFIMG_000583RA [Ceratocystis fimbriata CBS 114723]